jgi:hypothetical protein
MSIPGQLGLEPFRRQAIGVVPDIGRYQADEDDDLFFNGRTWALTNQLGANTGDYARSIGAAYPQLGLELHP